MSEPQAYLNGRFLPASQALLPWYDAGFVMGATVTEQLRTFGGRLFRLDDHVERLWHSLSLVGVNPGLSPGDLAAAARRLAAENHALLAPGDDLGLAIFVTPGPYAAMAGGDRSGPTVGMHTYPLPFAAWSDKYETGQALVTTDVVQVPRRSWPPELKCRSRMHYYLADRQAHEREPGARAVLVDAEGHLLEATTANLLVYRVGQGLISPSRAAILPGISLAAVERLAATLGIKFVERAIDDREVHAADEVLLTSTPFGLLPVVRFNGSAVGDGRPGVTFRRLLTAWNELVGLDMVEQARRFASR